MRIMVGAEKVSRVSQTNRCFWMAFLPVDNLCSVGLLMVRGVDLYGIVSMVWYVQHTYCRVL